MKMNAVQKLLVMVVGCVVLALGAVEAQAGIDSFWDLPSSGNFQEPTKWTAGVPGSVDRARFNENGSYTVTFSSSVTNNIVWFEAPGTAAVTLDIGAGRVYQANNSLAVRGANHVTVPSGALDTPTLEVGYDGGAASLTLSNATSEVNTLRIGPNLSGTTAELRILNGASCVVNSGHSHSGIVVVDNGELTVNTRPYFKYGAVLTITNNAAVSFTDGVNGLWVDGQGTVRIHGGTVTATKVVVLPGSNTGTVEIAGGTLVVNGDMQPDGANADVLISGGSVDLGGNLDPRNSGSFRMTGGSFTAEYLKLNAGEAVAGAHIALSGGTFAMNSGTDLRYSNTIEVIGTNATISFGATYYAWGDGITSFQFSHGGVSPIQIPAGSLWAQRSSPSALTLGLNGYMAAITTNAMTLFDCGVARTDDFTTKTDLSIFEAGRQIGDADDKTYEARLLAAEEVSEGPLTLGDTTTLTTPQAAGWIEIDPTGMSGTVDILVLLGYGGSKTQADLIADMTAAGLEVSETTIGAVTWLSITTPVPTWGSPAFAWDLTGFEANVKVEEILTGSYVAPQGTVISIQ